MWNALARLLFALQLLLLVVPLTMLYLYGAFVVLAGTVLAPSSAGVVLLVLLAVAGWTLRGGWVLAICYLGGGRAGLRRCSAGPWFAAACGALLAAAAMAWNLIAQFHRGGVAADAGDLLSPFMLGAALLLPLAQLALEHRLDRRPGPAR